MRKGKYSEADHPPNSEPPTEVGEMIQLEKGCGEIPQW